MNQYLVFAESRTTLLREFTEEVYRPSGEVVTFFHDLHYIFEVVNCI